jgi:hypothetical protein
MCRLVRIEPGDDVAERVIKRIGLPRRQRKRADAGLKRRAVAEIKPGQEG